MTKRFADKPYVRIIRGVVPDILGEHAPEKIAFLHLDMNAPQANKGALEFLFDRLSPGAVVVFDDYGWIQYRREKEVADEFFGRARLPHARGAADRAGPRHYLTMRRVRPGRLVTPRIGGSRTF